MSELSLTINTRGETVQMDALYVTSFPLFSTILDLNRHSENGRLTIREMVLIQANLPRTHKFYRHISYYGYIKTMEICGTSLFDDLPPDIQKYFIFFYVAGYEEHCTMRTKPFEELFFCE